MWRIRGDRRKNELLSDVFGCSFGRNVRLGCKKRRRGLRWTGNNMNVENVLIL